jgi:hypothetical protein
VAGTDPLQFDSAGWAEVGQSSRFNGNVVKIIQKRARAKANVGSCDVLFPLFSFTSAVCVTNAPALAVQSFPASKYPAPLKALRGRKRFDPE